MTLSEIQSQQALHKECKRLLKRMKVCLLLGQQEAFNHYQEEYHNALWKLADIQCVLITGHKN